MPDRVTILKGPVIKVLLPTRLRWFNGRSSGHRALHYAGDAGGVSSHGVGLLPYCVAAQSDGSPNVGAGVGGT